MGVLADSGLISRAAPALTDGYDEEVTDGRSVTIILDDVVDGSGDPLDPSGLTATCAAWAKVGDDTVVVTFETTWSTVDGRTRLKIHADDDAMRGAALGRRNRRCVWSLTFDDGTDSIDVWAAADSNLTIKGRG